MVASPSALNRLISHHPSLRYRRDRQRQLAAQKPELKPSPRTPHPAVDPVGPQEPPTAGTASAWGARSAGRGPLLWTTGTTAWQPKKGVPIARRYGVPVQRLFTTRIARRELGALRRRRARILKLIVRARRSGRVNAEEEAEMRAETASLFDWRIKNFELLFLMSLPSSTHLRIRPTASAFQKQRMPVASSIAPISIIGPPSDLA